jgi:hypothetical protein
MKISHLINELFITKYRDKKNFICFYTLNNYSNVYYTTNHGIYTILINENITYMKL